MDSRPDDAPLPGDSTLPSDPNPEPDPIPVGKSDRPIFPLLHNSAGSDTDPLISGTAPQARAADEDEDDDEPAVATPFVRTSSPDSSARDAVQADEDEALPTPDEKGTSPHRLMHRMHKFSLYETASRYYIVGGDVAERRYRILKIDRSTDDASDPSITDDKIVYSQKEMNQLLDTIDDGNKGTGGIKLRCTTWGLLGFIKFTGPWYMLLITKKSSVAMIGGHYIYQIDGTELVPLTPARFKADYRNTEESRFLNILNNLDLTRSFYYSYSYDITRTLQYNITKERTAIINGKATGCDDDYNSMFVWNSHLLGPAANSLNSIFDWCRPVIHGYIDQSAITIYGRIAFITIIARRSRYFAGARFLKRGANDLGYVANDVETEQIVSEALTTSFHAPGPKLFASPQYTSYVQHRGSIPLYWTQDNTGVTPKPPIELNLVDPFYGAAALHFDNLFERYGAPIYVLNLVKARERTPRESKLLDEYTKAIAYLNQFLPEGKKIFHRAWDMSRAAKSRDQDVIGTLEGIAENVVLTTGFFQNGDGHVSPIRAQNGVARTNCIDCLDRTNAAQFVIGKRALGHQLHALGILADTGVSYDTDAVNLFTHMYQDHGDTIAMQYGGSHLVNTMETYRKINQWTSHSRDMIESFKRYYNNSFLDGQRQEAYNLFLGNYIFAQGQPMLWDLATDYYLHHANPRSWLEQRKRGYIEWFTPEHLEERKLPPYVPPRRDMKSTSFIDDYWLEYYRPSTLSSFQKMFPFKMNSTIKYIPFKSTQEGRYDLSPFRVRNEGSGSGGGGGSGGASGNHDALGSKKPKKEVTILMPHDAVAAEDNDAGSVMSGKTSNTVRGLRNWLQPNQQDGRSNGTIPGIMKEGTGFLGLGDLPKHKPSSLEKTRAAQWTFTKMVHGSLNPSVDTQETDDYARYVAHPQNLPLVVSAESPPAAEVESEYHEYVGGSWMQHHGAEVPDEDRAAYAEMLRVNENPLQVLEEDAQKKRYKAYRKWLRGKSLFKQLPVD